MKLQKLKITQFRGLKDFECDFSDITEIVGTNGLGKTTILDSIMWLLCDETFTYGKQNDDNKNKHNHRDVIEVEGTFVKDNGDELVLGRKYFERWKENEEGEEEFAEVKNQCFINGATYKISEYLEKIRNEIGIQYDTKVKGINTLRLLIDYSYLNSIDYKVAKMYIESLIGTISDSDIVANEKYALIKDVLKAQNFDIVKAKSKCKNDKVKAEANIDTFASQIKAKKELVNNDEIKELEALEIKKQALLNANINSNNDYLALAEFLKENANLIQDKKENALKEVNESDKKCKDYIASGNKLVAELNSKKREIETEYAKVENAQKLIEVINSKINDVREQYKEIKTENFVAVECPECHYILNGDEKEFFESKKNTKLKSLEEKANASKKEIEAQNEIIKKCQANITLFDKEYKDLQDSLDKMSIEYKKEEENHNRLFEESQSNAEINALIEKKNDIENQMREVADKFNADNRNQLLEVQTKLTRIEDSKNKLREIENLETQLKEQKSNKALAETQLVLLEDFKQYKNQLIKENTNKVFKNVEFEMVCISPTTGALENCCHAKYKDVEYRGVNSGNQYPLGIEVIEDIKVALGVTEDLPVLFDRLADVDEKNFAKCLELTKAQIVGTRVTKDKEIKIIKENR